MSKHKVIIIILLILTSNLYAQIVQTDSVNVGYTKKGGIKAFFSTIEKPTVVTYNLKNIPDSMEYKPKRLWRPIVAIPAFKITESTREDAQADVLLFTSAGGGISYQYLKYDIGKNKYISQYSISPLTILLTGNLTGNNPIDISYLCTVGFFDDRFMIGMGYDLGVVGDRSRIFGAISTGINFNN